MPLYLPKSVQLENRVKDEIQRHFSRDLVDCKNRVQVVADVDMFKYKEDESVWNQHEQKTAGVYSIYFDGAFVCNFTTQWYIPMVMAAFWRGLKELIEADKVYLMVEQYEERIKAEKEAEKEKERKIEALPGGTPEKEIAKEVIRSIHKKKHGKNSRNV